MENPNTYILKYSNYLDFEGCKLAFKKGELFDITTTPKWIKFNGSFWLVNRKQLTKLKCKELIKISTIKVDISHLSWDRQEKLNHVFNLETL
jgi:hypothetical protein